MKDKTNYITQEQFQKLLDNIGHLPENILNHEALTLLFETIYEGALRVSEAINLKPVDLDKDHLQLILRETKGGKRNCKCVKKEYLSFEEAKKLKGNRKASYNFITKTFVIKTPDKDCKKCEGTGKYRVKEFAWVSPELFAKLVKYSSKISRENYLFPITRQMVWWYTKKLGNMIGVKMSHEEKETDNLFVHAIRHSRAVHLAEKMPINALSNKLRHKSLQPTKTYVDLARNDVQELEFGRK